MMKAIISLGMICTSDTGGSSICWTIESTGFRRVASLFGQHLANGYMEESCSRFFGFHIEVLVVGG